MAIIWPYKRGDLVMVRLACAFTGHRPRKFPWGYNEEDAGCKHLKAALQQEIALLARNGYTDFLSGMAEGTDTWAALDVLELREAHPELKFPLYSALQNPGRSMDLSRTTLLPIHFGSSGFHHLCQQRLQ